MSLECTNDCTLEVTAKIYYKGYDGALESEILDAFLDWLQSITPGTQILEVERTVSSVGELNGVAKSSKEGSESNGNKTAFILPLVFAALVGIGLAFMMYRRVRGRKSFAEEDSLVFESNERNLQSKTHLRSSRRKYSNVSTGSSDEIIVFPVSSNSLNNEYEVNDNDC